MDRTGPLISIMTPSYNQGAFIARTLDSVRAQSYPHVEHIVVDALSSDETASILARYPGLRVVREKDRGQADAINKGMALANGDILAFLNSDDVLYPGALEAVVAAFDADPTTQVVMGRCRFIDVDDRFTGIEHPAAFESFERILAIWKGHAIPQPSVFWRRDVWERCGPLDIEEQLVLDYDFFCRVAQAYRFTFIDQVLSGYRLQPESKTAGASDAERLDQSVRVSRRYWGAKTGLRYWRLELSWQLHRLQIKGRGQRLLVRAREAWRAGRYLESLLTALPGAVILPRAVFYGGVYPRLRAVCPAPLRRLLQAMAPASLAGTMAEAPYRFQYDVWPDGWVGPRFEREVTLPGPCVLELRGEVDTMYLREPLRLSMSLGPHSVEISPDETGRFSARFALPGAEAGLRIRVQVEANAAFTPHSIWYNGDCRSLSWRLQDLRVEPLEQVDHEQCTCV